MALCPAILAGADITFSSPLPGSMPHSDPYAIELVLTQAETTGWIDVRSNGVRVLDRDDGIHPGIGLRLRSEDADEAIGPVFAGTLGWQRYASEPSSLDVVSVRLGVGVAAHPAAGLRLAVLGELAIGAGFVSLGEAASAVAVDQTQILETYQGGVAAEVGYRHGHVGLSLRGGLEYLGGSKEFADTSVSVKGTAQFVGVVVGWEM